MRRLRASLGQVFEQSATVAAFSVPVLGGDLRPDREFHDLGHLEAQLVHLARLTEAAVEETRKQLWLAERRRDQADEARLEHRRAEDPAYQTLQREDRGGC